MKAEEEFDDIFRKKTGEAKFNFRHSDWEKVRQQIDEQRLAEYRNVSGINYWMVSLVALLGSAALIYFSIPDYNPSARADEVVYQPETPIENSFKVPTLPAEPAQLPVQANKQPEQEYSTLASVRKTSLNLPANSPKSSRTPRPKNLTAPVQVLPLTIGETKEEAAYTEAETTINGVEALSDVSDQLIMNTLYPRKARLEVPSQEAQLYNGAIFLREEPDYVAAKTPVKHSVQAEFGLMINGSSWMVNDLQSGQGLNFFGGLNYNRMLSEKWSLNMGAQLYNLQGLNTVFYQNSSNDFGFGSTQTQTVLTCHSMLFVSFPLRFYFHPDQKNSFSAGLHAGSLLIAKNTEEDMILSDGQMQQYRSKKQNAVYENMNSANFLVSAGFNRIIQERVSLQVELFYGLSDLFASTAQFDVRQNTSGIRIGLNYRFTGK